jgi:hypothetical protein
VDGTATEGAQNEPARHGAGKLELMGQNDLKTKNHKPM